MSWEENWEAIKNHRIAADAAAQQSHDSAADIVRMLREGVSIEVAHRIIAEHWGDTSVGNRIRTRLFSAFPKENGNLIMFAPLGQDDLNKFRGEYGEVVNYFEVIHQYVLETVKMLTEKLNKADPNDDEAYALYNGFRADALRYTCYVDDMFFNVRDALENNVIGSWADLREMLPVIEVDNGDYLFMDEFITRLEKVQRHYIGNELEIEARDSFSVSDIEWVLKKCISHIKIPYLFAEHLNTLLQKA